MSSSRLPVDSELILKTVIFAFVAVTEPTSEEKQKIDFCEALALRFLTMGVDYIYTFNVDEPKFALNATKKKGRPRITIFHERGQFPRCFWFNEGELVNYTFSPKQFPQASDWIDLVSKAWQGFCTN